MPRGALAVGRVVGAKAFDPLIPAVSDAGSRGGSISHLGVLLPDATGLLRVIPGD